jgi:NAD(P)-dependent dehydrogenase (short-subunit alcohol dehydrogenase family)
MESMMTESPNPVALVTGGTSGIGLATAQEFRKRGYGVLVTGTNPATLASARDALPSEVVVLQADARQIASADTVADELRTQFGRVDAVVLNAGSGRMLPIEAVDEATYDEHFAINVKGQFFTLQKALPLVEPGGSVIFLTSVGSHVGAPNFSVYTATKGALRAMVRALAVELAPRGVRVNSVSPGPVDNAAFVKLGLPPVDLAQFKAMLPQRVPLGRFGVEEEIARVIAFLASPDASYITGEDVRVDGGLAAAL